MIRKEMVGKPTWEFYEEEMINGNVCYNTANTSIEQRLKTIFDVTTFGSKNRQGSAKRYMLHTRAKCKIKPRKGQ